MDIVQLAAKVNWTLSTNQKNECINAMVELCNKVQFGNGKKLLLLDDSECQVVGLAFVAIALHFDNGDEDINSVAAENAYYCLARSFIKTENRYVLPAIYTLLDSRVGLLAQELIANWCEIAQKQVGMPIGMMLGGNPFTDPRLQDFREQAIGFSKDIQYYVLSHFYDFETSTFLIATDLPYFLPSSDNIDYFVKSLNKNKKFDKSFFLNSGKQHFEGVYNKCTETLRKY